jgi:hypothetical protein
MDPACEFSRVGCVPGGYSPATYGWADDFWDYGFQSTKPRQRGGKTDEEWDGLIDASFRAGVVRALQDASAFVAALSVVEDCYVRNGSNWQRNRRYVAISQFGRSMAGDRRIEIREHIYDSSGNLVTATSTHIAGGVSAAGQSTSGSYQDEISLPTFGSGSLTLYQRFTVSVAGTFQQNTPVAIIDTLGSVQGVYGTLGLFIVPEGVMINGDWNLDARGQRRTCGR